MIEPQVTSRPGQTHGVREMRYRSYTAVYAHEVYVLVIHTVDEISDEINIVNRYAQGIGDRSAVCVSARYGPDSTDRVGSRCE